MASAIGCSGIASNRPCFISFSARRVLRKGYAIVAGLGPAVEFLETRRLENSDVKYPVTPTGNNGKPLFENGFLEDLQALRLTFNIGAMPEVTVAFAQQSLVRVRGPILQCQVLETALLNLINFQTLIATNPCARRSRRTWVLTILFPRCWLMPLANTAFRRKRSASRRLSNSSTGFSDGSITKSVAAAPLRGASISSSYPASPVT